MRLLHEYVKLMLEDRSVGSEAVVVRGLEAVVYDVEEMRSLIEDEPRVVVPVGGYMHPPAKVSGQMLDFVVRGYVGLRKPDEPCEGAYEVAGIAGEGGTLYRLAYALSPSGLLVSDRHEDMSPDAVSAWKRMAAEGKRGRHALNPDECSLSQHEFLNYAYEVEPGDVELLKAMQAAHESFLSGLPRGVDRGKFENGLMSAGKMYFGSSIR